MLTLLSVKNRFHEYISTLSQGLQLQYKVYLLTQTDTVFLFIGLSTGVKIYHNKKKKHSSYHVPAKTTPGHFGGPDNILLHHQAWVLPCFWLLVFLFRQFLNDNPGYWIPPCGCVTSGVIGAGPHPHGHIHQPCFDALAEPFDWRGGIKTKRETVWVSFKEHPNCLHTWKLLIALFSETVVNFP